MAEAATTTKLKLFSADSHISEPGDCYVDNIEAKYRNRAPRIIKGPKGGDFYALDDYLVSAAHTASAGMDLGKSRFEEMSLEEGHRGAFDAKARLLDQDRDGIVGEVLYPSLGMLVCGHADPDFKNACMNAYNRWLQGFVAVAPDRLIGLGQTAVRSVAEAVDDLQRIREMGFKGAMLPAEPCTEFDYDSPEFDPLWRAAVELKLPVSFHIGTSVNDRATFAGGVRRGGKANLIHEMMRVNQDIIGMFIWGAIFERHPDLKLVCVEADASWAPHYMQRMDHYWGQRPDMQFGGTKLAAPSHYFRNNVFVTFQNDWVAFDMVDQLNLKQLLWANDYPHPDATWPHSQALLAKHASQLTAPQAAAIFHDNVRELYGLDAVG